MSQPFSLQPLLELMQTRTDEATRQLGQLIANEQNAKSRLQMLEDYRAEYANRLRDAIAQGMTRQVLANYQDFLGRIDEAITQQTLTLRQSEETTSRGKQHWKEQHSRLKAIDTLSIRHEAKERQREGKAEQKLQDEFSSRKFAISSMRDKD
jgi:flagellar protein FliJ